MSAAISSMDPDAANEGTGPRPHPGGEHSCEPSSKQVVETLIESYNWEGQSSVPRKASKAQTTLEQLLLNFQYASSVDFIINLVPGAKMIEGEGQLPQ